MENSNLTFVQTKLATATKQDRQSEINMIAALQRAVRCAYAGSTAEASFIITNGTDKQRKSAVSFFNTFGVDVAKVVGGLPRVLGVKDKSAQAKMLDGVRKVDSLGWLKASTESDLKVRADKKAQKREKYVTETKLEERVLKALQTALKATSDDADVNIALNKLILAYKEGAIA